MIQITPPQNPQYWINQRALTFSENDLENVNRIAVSLVSGTVIMVYEKGVIDYAPDGNFQKWTLKGYSTRLVSNSAHHIYARLSRTEKDALIVFSINNYNIDGSITTIVTDASGNPVLDEDGKEQTTTSEPNPNYWYVKIGEITATNGTSNRELTYDSGALGTKKGEVERGSWTDMFELSKESTPWLIFVKQMFYEFTVKNPITLLSGLIFKNSKGVEKKVTDVKRSTDSDNEYLLDEEGNVQKDENGNELKDPDYVPISDETIPTTKYIKESTEGKFIRKDQSDRTPFDLAVGGKTTAEKGIQIGKEFVSGLLGKCANIDEYGQAELESLFIRTFLEVPELRYNRVTVRMGDEINSVSAGVIESVTPDKDADGNILTTGTLTLKLEDTDIGTLEYDDIVTQIYSDLLNKENNSDVTSDDGKGNRHMKGFATVMFKVLEVSGERNEIIRYSLRPLSDNWKKQVHPYQFGSFSQRGNFSNKDRQIIVYKGLYPKPYTRYMDGVNDWEFTTQMIGMQLGYLGNLTVNGQEMSGYSAYLNNVYFTGMIRQLYIPQWMDGESSAQNGTLVYMGGDHYVSKGDTNNPPLFDLTDEDGNGLIFTDENGDEGNILDLNSEEYDMLAKKGEDGVGIQSTVFYYMLTAINEKPLEDSEKWGTSLIQPTDLESYLWKKTVVTYTNLTKQVTIECISVRGKDGTSVSIKGSYDTEAELKAAYPNGPANPSDAYIVGGDLYVWNGAEWKNVGAIQGEKGDTAYVHIKYANETTTGTQVTVNGVVVTLSFTANDGEDTGDWMGVYTDHIQADSTNIASYKWKNIKGSNGNDSTSYWLDSPVGVINFTTDGYPSPTSFVVSMKKKKGNGAVESCADFYLATWRYDGNWQLVSTSSVKTSSVTIIPAQSTTYKQYRITAHTTASASQSNIVTELGIGVSVNGLKGDKGDDGIFVYDTDLYDKTRAYYYKKMSDGTVRRDKMVYEIGGSFYNYLVRTLTSEDSAGLINTPPTSIDGDENWEVMSTFQSLIANTVFGTNANIGGFMASAEKLRTQSEVGGKPKFELNGSQGTQTMRQDGGTVWDVNADGVQSVGFENGERIVLDPNNQSISVYDENGIQRTNLDGKEYTREQLIVTSGGTFTLDSNASNTGGKTLSSSSSLVATASYPLTGLLNFSYAGVAEITVSDFYMSLYHSSRALSNTTPTVIPNGKAYMYLCTYTSSSASLLKSKRLIAYRSVSDATVDGDVTTSDKLSGTFSVAVSSGYHRIEVAMEATNGSSTGSTGVTAYWSLSSAKIVVESYMSRMFANGMMLSKSSNEYFMTMLDGDTMNVEAVSGTSGIKLHNGALQYKYNDSDWCNIPISLMFVRVTATGANTFTSSYKTFDGSPVSVTSSAEGVYDISIPPSWSSLVSIDSVNIQATGYGRYRGGSSNAVCWASVLSVTNTSVRIATSYNSNNEFDACGFYMEMKRI